MAEPRHPKDDIDIQRQYYASNAMQYDEMHVNESDEHFLALHFLGGVIEHFDFQSALDIGSGTGRAVDFLIRRFRGLRVVGIEPVAELRDIGHKKGIPSDALVPGDAMRLAYENDAFDVVCEFGMLHHIPEPHRAVAEMLRVARHAVFISDSNNFGQGSFIKRSFKQLVNLLGLWKAFDSIKTRGKGFRISEGDGLSYSYSVFNNYSQIRHACSRIHILNTTSTAGINLYRSASHVAMLGIK